MQRHRAKPGAQQPAQQAQAARLKEAVKQQCAAKSTQGRAPQASAKQETTSWPLGINARSVNHPAPPQMSAPVKKTTSR